MPSDLAASRVTSPQRSLVARTTLLCLAEQGGGFDVPIPLPLGTALVDQAHFSELHLTFRQRHGTLASWREATAAISWM